MYVEAYAYVFFIFTIKLNKKVFTKIQQIACSSKHFYQNGKGWLSDSQATEMAVVGIGARNEHALDEHIYVEDMEKALKMIVELLRLSAE